MQLSHPELSAGPRDTHGSHWFTDSLKIVMGPDATTKRRRLEGEQKSSHSTRGEGAVGEQSVVSSLVAGEEHFRRMPSVTTCDTVSAPRLLGAPGGLGALLHTGCPSPVPPRPPQPSPRESATPTSAAAGPHLPVVPGGAAWQQPQLLALVMETAAAAGDGHL